MSFNVQGPLFGPPVWMKHCSLCPCIWTAHCASAAGNSHATQCSSWLSFAAGEEAQAGGDDSAARAKGKAGTGNFPWSGSDRDYTYEELLGACIVIFISACSCFFFW